MLELSSTSVNVLSLLCLVKSEEKSMFTGDEISGYKHGLCVLKWNWWPSQLMVGLLCFSHGLCRIECGK